TKVALAVACTVLPPYTADRYGTAGVVVLAGVVLAGLAAGTPGMDADPAGRYRVEDAHPTDLDAEQAANLTHFVERRGTADRGQYRQAAGAIESAPDVGSAIRRNISRLARALESLTSISSQRSFNRRLNARSRTYNLPRGTQSATAHTIKTTR